MQHSSHHFGLMLTMVGLSFGGVGCQKQASPDTTPQVLTAPKHKKVLGGGTVELGAPPAKVAAALKGLKMGLKVRLQGAMKAGGPIAALTACNHDAPGITATAQAAGIKVGRTSHRLRNPANTVPKWAAEYVAKAADKRLDKVPGRMTVNIEGGKKGYLEMIGTASMCLRCHGPSNDLDPKLKAKIATLYPNDTATGFSTGDVRGWFWAEYTP